MWSTTTLVGAAAVTQCSPKGCEGRSRSPRSYKDVVLKWVADHFYETGQYSARHSNKQLPYLDAM